MIRIVSKTLPVAPLGSLEICILLVPHGSFQPNLVRRFGLMFNQSLAVGYGSVRQVWVCLVIGLVK